MEMLCISTFDNLGKLSGLTLNRTYKVRWSNKNKILVKNDFGQFFWYDNTNFINYEYMKALESFR